MAITSTGTRAREPDVRGFATSADGLELAYEVAERPFLYFPLRGHFEQNHHVAHRLRRQRAGRRMDYERDGAAEIAAAIAEELDRPLAYRPVPPNGAARAARAIAELL